MKCHIQFPGKNQKKETVCMKCRIESSGKNKKIITNLSPAESAQSGGKCQGKKQFSLMSV